MTEPPSKVTRLLIDWSHGDQAAFEKRIQQQSKVVELRFFGGLTNEETAEAAWSLADDGQA